MAGADKKPELPSKAELLDVQSWRKSEPSDELRYLEWYKKHDVPGETSWWMSDGGVRPSDLYCYLKARFGPPMGLLTLLRRPDSSELFHWHFHVSIGDGRFEAISSNRGIELRVVSAEALGPEDQRDLLDRIKADFGRVGADMARVRAKLEPWTMFINPFARLNRLVGQYYDELLDLENSGEPPRPPSDVIPSSRDVREFHAAMEKWTEGLRRASHLALALQLTTPVLGEAFVNLTILLLANSDLRTDRRLYDARIRDQIDVRLRGLHQICRGFRQALDPEAEEFKQFHSIMNQRNDLLHGNVDPLTHRFDEIYFEGTVPIFKEDDVFLTRFPRLANESLRPGTALDAVEWVSAFVLYVLECLDDDHHELVLRCLNEEALGWREDKGRVGVLFPDAISIGFAGPSPDEE